MSPAFPILDEEDLDGPDFGLGPRTKGQGFGVDPQLLVELEGEVPTPELESELVAELAPKEEDEKCPQCGGVLRAELSPSALTFPMQYTWRCTGCSHEETRLDKHQGDAALPALVDGDGDLF